MANLRKTITGISVNIWIQQEVNWKMQHSPYRIKVQDNSGDNFQNGNTLSIVFDKDLNIKKITGSSEQKKFFSKIQYQVQRWLNLNKPQITEYLLGNFSSSELERASFRI
jgi:hypothetical protein